MTQRPSSVAIVGGGLAGLAAAVVAAQNGLRVELFEQAGRLGGRAGSFVDSETGQQIDYCQHVAMGCCTSFLDFCRRTHIDDCFQRTATLHFIGPEGARHDFSPSRWLPAPLHLLPALMGLKYLTIAERWGIVRALRKLTREQHSPHSLGERPAMRAEAQHSPHPSPLPEGEGTSGNPCPEGEETVGAWLRRQGQSDRCIGRFWSVILVSALGETIDWASLAAARKVFSEGFLASRGASDLVLPRRPLGEIFHDRVGNWLANAGVKVHLRTPIRQIDGVGRRISTVIPADGTRCQFDAVIVAVPWRNVRSLFTENLLAAMPALANVDRIEPGAITAVHLWFDRPITPLPHAILVGRLSQWVFSDIKPRPAVAPPIKPRPAVAPPMEPPPAIDDRGFVSPTHHYQAVISASHRLPARKHDELLAEVRRELEAVWPAVGQPAARLLHGRVVTQPAAVFSVSPGLDRFRPPSQTPLENLALAGDWTATGWPATMEGAIRSGYRAAEVLELGKGTGPFFG